jgi:hypothetical protein
VLKDFTLPFYIAMIINSKINSSALENRDDFQIADLMCGLKAGNILHEISVCQ